MIPDFVAELIERVAFEAREDKRIDQRSGVSQRLPISVLENVISNAERRALALGEPVIVPRVSDIYAAIPSITGKLELEYEGELQGGETIARELIRRAAGRVMEERLPEADLDPIVEWFDQGGALKVASDERTDTCLKGFSVVPGLVDRAYDYALADRDHPGHRRRRLRTGAGRPGRRETHHPAAKSWAISGPSPSGGSRRMGREA